MLHRLFSAGFFVCACLNLTTAARAEAGDSERRGVTLQEPAAAVFERMRRHYGERPVAERITLRVTSEGQTQGDEILFTHVPGSGTRIEMGALVAVLDERGLRAAHRANRVSYYFVPASEGDDLATLRRALPPLPIVQPVLALSSKPMSQGLSPYLMGVSWNDARTYIEMNPSLTVLSGQSERARVEIELVATSGAVRVLRMTLDDAATVEARSFELAEPGPRDVAFDEAGRTPSDQITALTPTSADVRVGDSLPHMELLSWPDPVAPASLEGPAAAVFFTNHLNFRPAEAASRAEIQIVRRVRGFHMLPTLVFQPFQPEKELMLSKIVTMFDATGLFHTDDPGATLDRFALPEGVEPTSTLLVAWDVQGKVVLIRPLDDEVTREQIASMIGEALDPG